MPGSVRTNATDATGAALDAISLLVDVGRHWRTAMFVPRDVIWHSLHDRQAHRRPRDDRRHAKVNRWKARVNNRDNANCDGDDGHESKTENCKQTSDYGGGAHGSSLSAGSSVWYSDCGILDSQAAPDQYQTLVCQRRLRALKVV
jgi:hypothetical protein